MACPELDHLTVTFINDQENEVEFHLNTTTPLMQAINAYCKHQNVVQNTTRFFFDHHRLMHDDTPESLGMTCGDIVNVHKCQSGGGGGDSDDGTIQEDRPKALRLKVKDQQEGVLEFNLKYTTPMKKMMVAYCKTKQIDVTSVRFLYEGVRLNFEDTAADQGMQDMSVIEAFLEQHGGEGEAEEPPKEEKKTIELVVKDQNGNEITFKVKNTTPLGKVRDAYCQKNEKDPKAIRFLFDGSRIQDTDTPSTLDMEDGDVIDVFLEQLGGDSK